MHKTVKYELPLPAHNPFASARVRPGALPFHFDDGMTAGLLCDRFAELGYNAAIVGPHGSGKSTLLATLRGPLLARGWQLQSFVMQPGQRRLDPALYDVQEAHMIIVLDGHDQLTLGSRGALRCHCRRHGLGLLVTSHRRTWLSTLIELQPSLATLQALTHQLLPKDANQIVMDDVERLFQAHGGNMREVFFSLHRLFEERSRNVGA